MQRLERPDGWLAWSERGAPTNPCVVIAHGAGRMAKHYEELATMLSSRFRVVTYDRRGRGESSPRSPHGMQSEVDDLLALCRHTGATRVFGHSAGALISLEAARTGALERIAVYDPPAALTSLANLDWWPRFEDALSKRRHAYAFALFVSNMQFGPPKWMPVWFITLGVRLLMLGKQGPELAALLHTIPGEFDNIRALAEPFERYRSIAAPVLLLYGAETPSYLRTAATELSTRIPSCRIEPLAHQGHNAPDLTGVAEVARRLRDWL